MPSSSNRTASPFTAPERELIRQGMCQHFGQYPELADGLFLRTWRGGPLKGQPKIPPAVQSLLDRGLVTIGTGRVGFAAFFTEAGLAALRELLRDHRAMDPVRFAHPRQELGIDKVGEA